MQNAVLALLGMACGKQKVLKSLALNMPPTRRDEGARADPAHCTRFHVCVARVLDTPVTDELADHISPQRPPHVDKVGERPIGGAEHRSLNEDAVAFPASDNKHVGGSVNDATASSMPHPRELANNSAGWKCTGWMSEALVA